MKLYLCYDLLKNVRTTGRPGGHPCGNAYKAMRDAGYDPELVPVGGLGVPILNRTKGRAEVERLTGQRMVPVLELDNGEMVFDSKKIVAWAAENPASGAEAAA